MNTEGEQGTRKESRETRADASHWSARVASLLLACLVAGVAGVTPAAAIEDGMTVSIHVGEMDVIDGDAFVPGQLETISLCKTVDEGRDEVELTHLLNVEDRTPMALDEDYRVASADLTAYRLEYGQLEDGTYGWSRGSVVESAHVEVPYDVTGEFVSSTEVALSVVPGSYAPAIELVQVVSFERIDIFGNPMGGDADERATLITTCDDDDKDPGDGGGDEDDDPPTGPLPGYGTFCSYEEDSDSNHASMQAIETSKGTAVFVVADLTPLANAVGAPDCNPGKLTQYLICTTLADPGGICAVNLCDTASEGACNPCPTGETSGTCGMLASTVETTGDLLYDLGVSQRETLLSVVESAYPYGSSPASGILPGSTGRSTTILGQGTANGQVCLTVPTDSVAGTADTTALDTFADNVGDSNPGTPVYIAAIGDVSYCEEDKAVITQASSIVSAGYVFIDGVEGHMERSWGKFFGFGAACIAGIAVTGALAFATAASSPTGIGAFALGSGTAVVGVATGAACTAAGNAALGSWDPGWIRCGYDAAGVTFGGQDSASDVETLPTLGGLLDWSLTSGSEDTQSWWFGADGGALGTGPNQPYVGVHDPVRRDDYAAGEGDCKRAADLSQKEAEHQAETYGTVTGANMAGDASLDLTVELIGPIYADGSDALVPIGDNVWWSPVYGLSVGCDGPTNCPLQVGVTASQCGKVTVRGGAPSEMTYEFLGQPQFSECELQLSVHVNGNSTPVAQVPYLILELHYEGAGNG